MQWSRVKSILLVILLLVNGFFVVNLAGKYASRYYRDAEITYHMREILSSRGIRPGADFSLPESVSLPVLQIDRSQADEDAFSEGLLGGSVTREEKPGGACTYVGASGALTWSGGGEVTGAVRPADYVRPAAARDLQAAAQDLLRQAGVSNVPDVAVDEAAGTVTVSFPTAGVPVFNRALTFAFGDDRVTLSGWWTFGVPYAMRGGSVPDCAAADAVFTFLAKNEIGCLERVEAGFLMSENGVSRVQMTPGWRLVTDKGEFFVDSLKKSSVSIEKN